MEDRREISRSVTDPIAEMGLQSDIQVMVSRARSLLLIAISVIAGICAGWYLREQRDIDACLHAGGRWEMPGGYCIGAMFGSPQY